MRGKSPHTNITATKHPLFCCHIRLHVHFMSIYFCLFWETLHRFYRCASEWAWFERKWSETSNGGGSDSIIFPLHYWLTTCIISELNELFGPCGFLIKPESLKVKLPSQKIEVQESTLSFISIIYMFNK